MKSQIVFLLSLILLVACVPKKKFLAMEETYMVRIDSLAGETVELNKQLTSAERDYETMKQDLMISDAAKTDRIVVLENQAKKMQADLDRVAEALSDTRTRYKSTHSQSLKTTSQLKQMADQLVTLRQDTASLNYALKIQRRKAVSLQNVLDKQLQKNTQDMTSNAVELSKLAEEVAKSELKTQEVKKQLVLKQKQMDAVEAAFIALRKDLLRAKAQGTAIDPNTNVNVSKLAKSLGQY